MRIAGNKDTGSKTEDSPVALGGGDAVERARAWRQLLAPLVVNVRRETLVRLSPCVRERIGHGRSYGAASHECAGHGIVFSTCSRQELCRQLTVRATYLCLSGVKSQESRVKS